jgi:stage II sporulation protein GA (sporulation sigma-E factor processing peptidase)
MLLLLTDKLAHLHTNRFRIAFGALIASLIVPLTIYYPDHFFTTIIGKLLFSILIILSSFGFKNVYQTARLLLLFYLMSFAIGGGLMAVHFLTHSTFTVSQAGILTYNAGYGDPISWLFVVIGFPFVWFFTKQRMDKHVQEKVRYDVKYAIRLKINGIHRDTTGFIDSGNQLVDPFTKKPVVICDEAFIAQWFEREDWIKLKIASEKMDMEALPSTWTEKLKIIPYQGVEGGHGFLFAIIPDELIIYYNNKEIKTSHVLIGIQFGTLTKDESYHCLLQPELIQSAMTYTA